jgi:hypothetical protein
LRVGHRLATAPATPDSIRRKRLVRGGRLRLQRSDPEVNRLAGRARRKRHRRDPTPTTTPPSPPTDGASARSSPATDVRTSRESNRQRTHPAFMVDRQEEPIMITLFCEAAHVLCRAEFTSRIHSEPSAGRTRAAAGPTGSS